MRRWLLLCMVLATSCARPTNHDRPPEPSPPAVTATAATGLEGPPSDASPSVRDAAIRPVVEDLAAFARADVLPDSGTHHALLSAAIGVEPGRFNLGNPRIARHTVDALACEAALGSTVFQTAEQRAQCRGFVNMVPIFRGGDAASAKVCIDVFEYPNRACELPAVWGTPAEADVVCRSEGKRLCSQPEWTLACAGDPAGGPDRAYAYGDQLDLDVCNTRRPHPFGPDGETWVCSARTAQTAWETCATETEPAGAFPGCRSRFGVFDLHGNVAEIMTRTGADGETLTQLKGSAFFYVDVARQPTEAQNPRGRETYPDTCAYDPRWHVERLEGAMHSNYHLGFRCCVGI